MELFDLLDSPSANAHDVAAMFKRFKDIEVTIDTVREENGVTDFIKVLVPGKNGKSSGGTSPTLGILGTLGGLGARPEVTGFVSDGDGALAALSAGLKIAGMHHRGDVLEGDVIITTHICPDAPTEVHYPVTFMDSPVCDATINKYTVCKEMDAILTVDTTKGNMVINNNGFAISATVKEGYILKVSTDLLEIMKRVTGKNPVVFPLSVQDITPFGNGLSHLNCILQPSVNTDAPVVGVAITTETVIAGCATGASHFSDVESAARFCVEAAKDYGTGKCSFFDEKEYGLLKSLYGDAKRIQTFGTVSGEKIGVLRIAHSGIAGVREEIESFLGPGFEVIEKGALDQYSYDDIVEGFAPIPGGNVLTSGLRTGETVLMDEHKVFLEMQKTLKEFEEENIKTVIVFCTGFFSGFEFSGMLIEPGKVVKSFLAGLNIRNIGIIVPEEDQIAETMANYDGFNPCVVAASPYKGMEGIMEAAEKLRLMDKVPLIILDCMGFDKNMRAKVMEKSKKPVILPRMMAAKLLNNMF
jgi:Protein of unknown function (DUF1177)./AroM protein.